MGLRQSAILCSAIYFATQSHAGVWFSRSLSFCMLSAIDTLPRVRARIDRETLYFRNCKNSVKVLGFVAFRCGHHRVILGWLAELTVV